MVSDINAGIESNVDLESARDLIISIHPTIASSPTKLLYPTSCQRWQPLDWLKKSIWSSIYKDWIKQPVNIALLIWLACVSISASMLALLLIGLLNKPFSTKSSRDHWIEINSQVLNALFTFMSLYQHPNLINHSLLLYRWTQPDDVVELRKVYCKNGSTQRPHERVHFMVVVVLLHVTCLAQYVLCGLYWGYSRDRRPVIAGGFFGALGTVAPVIAGAYCVYSPLGRVYSSVSDEVQQGQVLAGEGEVNENRPFLRPLAREGGSSPVTR